VALLTQAAGSMGQKSRLVLLDSATLKPQSVSSAALLPELSATEATETAADLPVMISTALDYITANRTGVTELWIASDLQRSNWHPESPSWQALMSRMGGMPQAVKVRLLSLAGPASDNLSVRARNTERRRRGEESELDVAFEISRLTEGPVDLPVTISLDGGEQQVECHMEGPRLLMHRVLPLGEKKTGGWGWVELPSDVNRADNRSYFVYGEEQVLQAVVVGEEERLGRIFSFAAAPAPELQGHQATFLAPEQAGRMKPGETSLVIWNAAFPGEELQERLRGYVEEGGVLICFPSKAAGPALFGTWSWNEVESARTEEGFKIASWERESGPLAKTASGAQLPLSDQWVGRRATLVGEAEVLARFADGTAFMSHARLGKGEVLFCATLPAVDWSSLWEGTVLVPVFQRLLSAGGKRLTGYATAECGDWSPAGGDEPQSLEGERDWRTQAGIYRVGRRVLALDRPEREDQPGALGDEDVRRIFENVSFQMLGVSGRRDRQLQSEIWRIFLFGVLACMLGEAVLILPVKGGKKEEAGRVRAASSPREGSK
jgi:hypothetical protein